MKKTDLPSVVIVGRTNVGKSTLFNRLSDDIKSLVFDTCGVTRDLISETISWQGKNFDLIDTGGVSFKKIDDRILQQTQIRAQQAMENADLLVLVCDGIVGPLIEDRAISSHLHKLGKKVLVVINKIDDKRCQEHIHEFVQLGHLHIIEVSAQHGKGIADLLEQIVNHITKSSGQEEVSTPASFRVIAIGKPNVGKSSLINNLLKEDRFIVADQPGTTREAISATIRFCKEDICVTDTPGIRRKRSVQDPLETLMVKSSFSAVQDSDIVLLVVDGSAGGMVDQEFKLAFYTFEKQYKALVVLFNKDDITDESTAVDLENSMTPYKYFFNKVMSIQISCKTGKNVGKIVPMIDALWKRHSQEIPSDELTSLLRTWLERKPLYKNQQLLKLFNATQIKSAPLTILLRVSYAPLFQDSQCAFFERILRNKYDLRGVPVRFIIRTAGQK